MRNFTKGNADLIAKASRESIKATFMDGDGCQAPGAIVLRKVRDASRGDYRDEWAVHFANTQCGGYHGGDYTGDYAKALTYFDERVARYDPDGSRRASFEGFVAEVEPA